MKIIRCKDYENMSRIAAIHLFAAMIEKQEKRVNIAITVGSTPARLYELIAPTLIDHPFPNVHYYNFDNIPLKGKEGMSLTSLKNCFLSPCHIPMTQMHVMDEHNYMKYDTILAQDGGLDCVLMGIGWDGHFCGNLAGTLDNFREGTRAVSTYLNEGLTKHLSELAGGVENLTDFYVTYGPKTIMNARKIILIVNGLHKAEILKKALEGEVSVDVPASILQLHPNCFVICDQDAASLLNP